MENYIISIYMCWHHTSAQLIIQDESEKWEDYSNKVEELLDMQGIPDYSCSVLNSIQDEPASKQLELYA